MSQSILAINSGEITSRLCYIEYSYSSASSTIMEVLLIPRRLSVSLLSLAITLFSLLPSAATAHHSAALFYSMGDRISLQGEVISFNFRNPHAILELQVTDENGTTVRWTCETSAPSALRRRGWSQESITRGEFVTLDGVPASDGSNLMRITSVTKADGSQVGVSARMDD